MAIVVQVNRMRGCAAPGTSSYAARAACEAVLFTGMSCARSAEAPATERALQAPPASGQSGLVVYKNPTTGAFEAPPRWAAPPVASPPLAAGLNTSFVGLTEVRSPASGTMVDLRGRFQNLMRVTVSKDGAPIAGDCTNDGTAVQK